MRDPTPAEWVLGLIVAIGAAVVIAIGTGWYPRLNAGERAEWVAGIGTVLAVIVALFGHEIRDQMFGPKLDVVVSTEPPDCVRVPIAFGPPLGGKLDPIDSIYVRIRVGNHGQSLARDVQVFAESVAELIEQQWRPIRIFPSMNLPWADLPSDVDVKLRMFFPGLGPAMSKHCDLGRIVSPRLRNLVGDEKTGLNATSNAFAFETLVTPNNQGHIVGPGSYRIRLLLAAENARDNRRAGPFRKVERDTPLPTPPSGPLAQTSRVAAKHRGDTFPGRDEKTRARHMGSGRLRHGRSLRAGEA